jgi:hypothetical protein
MFIAYNLPSVIALTGEIRNAYTVLEEHYLLGYEDV